MSSEVISLFVNDLDNTGLILKESDIRALKKNDGDLFKQIENSSEEYITGANLIFLKALSSVDSILDVLSNKNLNFTENDTLYFLPQQAKREYPQSLKVQAKKLEKYIKYKCYERVSNLEAYAQLDEKDFNLKAEEFKMIIISSLKKNIKQSIDEGYRHVESVLLNAIAQRYDPHSNFFTEEQNSEFTQQLSSTVETFGLSFAENSEDQIIVSAIEPGSSAWMSNEVNAGDQFISVKIGTTYYRNEDHHASEIQSILENTTEKNILLSLKKTNGLIKSVVLVKQKMASEDNTVKGYVLTNGSSHIGYISLPSFYTDMGETKLPGCANDVAKELLKLEKDSITGLIIDLRNNGGGSMQEAMNLAGIFIDEGPLFIYKEKNKKPSLMKDINRGSIFKKPLIVMINESSASASELFSNIMKDYHAGLIVGQTSYGKGTAQVVLPLDTNLLSNPNKSINSDYLKITTGKFYRLNCSTHQGVGVVPDIELPALEGFLSQREYNEAFYLKPDSVIKKLIYSPKSEIELSSLRSLSANRIKNSPDFKRSATISDSLSKVFSRIRKLPLKAKDYKRYKADMDAIYLLLDSSPDKNKKQVTCLNNTFDKKLNEVNEQVKDFNTKILNAIEKDLFIGETFQIINDLVKQEKN